MVDRLVEDRARAEDSLEDRPRGLARPEPGDLRPAAQRSHGVIDGAGEAFLGNFDFENDGTLGGGGGGHIHRGEV